MKPKAEFPPEGLGSSKSEGCKAVKVIKLLCKHAIQLSTLDEASAIDGSRPLDQIVVTDFRQARKAPPPLFLQKN